MRKDLSDFRKSYEKGALDEDKIASNPMQQFHKWFHEVLEVGGVEEANAMTISTKGLDGFPKGRVVLLKKFDKNGFYFYTNYKSEKGRAIEADNRICISFFWPNLERQVIIKGRAKKTSIENSNDYFQIRPRGSQLGAAASPQSEIISKKTLIDNLKQLEEKYKAQEVPRPEHWGGYCVKPISIEFWQGRENRLHDRIRYTLEHSEWKIERLAP